MSEFTLQETNRCNMGYYNNKDYIMIFKLLLDTVALLSLLLIIVTLLIVLSEITLLYTII